MIQSIWAIVILCGLIALAAMAPVIAIIWAIIAGTV